MDPFVIGSLISAGSSLLGGLFGRKKEKPPTRVTPLQLRNEALEAGFNPLTVLGASAGGGFGMNPGQTGVGLSSGELIANALSGFGQAFMRDPVEAETRELERDLLKEQVRAAREASRSIGIQASAQAGFGAGPKAGLVGLSAAPRVASAGRAAPPASAGPPPIKPGTGMKAEKMSDEYGMTNLRPDAFSAGGNVPWRARLGPNAVNLPSVVENYGELGEWIGGVWNAGDYVAWEAGQALASYLAEQRRKKDRLERAKDGVQRSKRSRELERYYSGRGKAPRWYDGSTKPVYSPFH